MKQFVRSLLAAAFIITMGLWISTASFWHSVDTPPEEKQIAAPSIIVDVTPRTKLVVDRILITQHAKFSMLRVRCRWVGDNISENYEARPSLDGIGHKESKEGSGWFSAMTKSPNDQRPGFPFTLDIKNPPADFDSLLFKITLKQRADRWWVDVPRLGPVSFSINRHDVEFPPVFQMRVALDVPTDETESMVLLQANKDASSQPQTLHLSKTVLLDQSALRSAFFYTNNPGNEPSISIVFTDKGKERFATVTRDCIGERLAIVIGGLLYSAPTIQTEMTGDRIDISGSFNEQEARSLVAKINESLVKPQ